LALVHELAADLLQAERLDAYLLAHAAGRTDECARLLKEGAAELAACGRALDIEASSRVG
jgi:hypothetical protein